MFETRYGFLFGSSAVEFSSSYPLDDAIARLRAVVSTSEFFLVRQAAVGTVEESGVHLRRGGPSTNKAYRLRFDGAFQHERGVSLTGHFVVDGPREVQRMIIKCIWESLLMSCITAAVISPPFIPLLIAGVIGGNLWSCKSNRRFVRKDVAWLSTVIEHALTVQQ